MKLLVQVVDLLRSQKWEGVSDEMEIAKGKNAIPTTMKDTGTRFRRDYKMLKLKHLGYG